MAIYRRRTNMLIEPVLQLKLPVILLVATLIFATFQIGHSYFAFSDIFDDLLVEAGQPQYLKGVIEDQANTFIQVSAAAFAAYLLIVALLSATYVHRMVGPVVGFRRHIEALKNGDYSSRVRLRPGDAFAEMLNELNELAQLLEREDKKREP